MKKALLASAAIAALVSFSGAASAAGPYVTAFGGINLLQDSDIDLTFPGSPGETVQTTFKRGYGVGAAGGFAFDNGVRLEGEVAYRRNSFDRVQDSSGSSSDLNGNTTALSFMANAWYDIPTGQIWRPFIGGGIGVARLKASASESDGSQVFDDSDTVFAYQAGAGIKVQVTPKIEITGQYRYFATGKANFDLSASSGAPPGSSAEFGYNSHSILIGVVYNFN